MFRSPRFNLCTNGELKLSLRMRLALQTHARCIHIVEKSIAGLTLSALLTTGSTVPEKNELQQIRLVVAIP
jgi:hypothetical protein